MMYWFVVTFFVFLIVGEVVAYATRDYYTISQWYARFRRDHAWWAGLLYGALIATLTIHFSGWENSVGP